MKWQPRDDKALARMRFQGTSVGSMAVLLGRDRPDVQQRVTLHEWQEAQWGEIGDHHSPVVLDELRQLSQELAQLERLVDKVVGATEQLGGPGEADTDATGR